MSLHQSHRFIRSLWIRYAHKRTYTYTNVHFIANINRYNGNINVTKFAEVYSALWKGNWLSYLYVANIESIYFKELKKEY